MQYCPLSPDPALQPVSGPTTRPLAPPGRQVPAAARREYRTCDDEGKAEADAQGERLVQKSYPQDEGDGRVDIGDHSRADRPDLVDEGEKDEKAEQGRNDS